MWFTPIHLQSGLAFGTRLQQRRRLHGLGTGDLHVGLQGRPSLRGESHGSPRCARFPIRMMCCIILCRMRQALEGFNSFMGLIDPKLTS